jgi:hypothetical protein
MWARPPDIYSDGWEHTKREWEETARQYETSPESVYFSWNYLNGHPMFWLFRSRRPDDDRPPNNYGLLNHGDAFPRMSIDVILTRVSEEDGTEIRLEAGKWDLFERDHGGVTFHAHYHDYELDCGAPTYEEAIVKLARLVWDRYGNDRLIAEAS